jgi:site-specific DNA-adenine methylase
MHLPRDVQITNRDFIPIIADARQQRLLFCDPPYVLNNPNWPQRYHGYGFSDGDHARLAEMLRLTPHSWVLTYGDHCRVRELYQWADIEKLTDNQLLITRQRIRL